MHHVHANADCHAVRPRALASIDGQWINIADEADAIRAVRRDLRQGLGFTLHALTLEHLAIRRSDPAYRDAYLGATYVTCDTGPVAALARRQHRLVRPTSARDLIEPLCRLAATERLPVYLFGSHGEAVRRAAGQLIQRTPGLGICGSQSPPATFDPSSAGADAAIDRMAASGARLCLISIDSPRQELLSRRALDRHPHLGLVNIGNGIDAIAGERARAPVMALRARRGLLLAEVAIAHPIRRHLGLA